MACQANEHYLYSLAALQCKADIVSAYFLFNLEAKHLSWSATIPSPPRLNTATSMGLRYDVQIGWHSQNNNLKNNNIIRTFVRYTF